MGGFPEDEAKAFSVIALGTVAAAMARVEKVIVKTPHEATGIPTAEAIVNVRSETYEKATKNAFYAAPFWQNWKRYDDEAAVQAHLQSPHFLYRTELSTAAVAGRSGTDDLEPPVWELFSIHPLTLKALILGPVE